MTRPPMTAPDHIRELTQHHVTRQRIDRFVPIPNVTEPPFHVPAWTRIRELHHTEHAPLLAQLEEATTNATTGGAWGGGKAGSKPAARLDAIAVLQRIKRQSTKLADELGVPMSQHERTSLTARLLIISGKLGNTDHPLVKSWWVAARCTTGWEEQPYAPDVPCPNTDCERRSTLRIRLDEYLASCIECGATWDEHNYAQLGDYVRWASEHLHGAKHWVIDADGLPGDCPDPACAAERDAMAERAKLRAVAPMRAAS